MKGKLNLGGGLLALIVLVLLVAVSLTSAAGQRRRSLDLDADEFEGGSSLDLEENERRESSPPSASAGGKGRGPLGMMGGDSSAARLEIPVDWFPYILRFFPMELFGTTFVVFIATSYFINQKQNRQLVESFFRTHANVFSTQFHRMDFGDKEKVGSTVLRDGPCFYRLYGSGRKNLVSCTTTFELKHRQNVLRGVADFLLRSKDMVTMEVVLPKLPPFALMVFRDITKEDEESKRHAILSELKLTRAKEGTFKKGSALTCLTESDEALRAFAPFVEGVLSQCEYFESLLICDVAESFDEREKRMANSVKYEKDVAAQESLGVPSIVLRFRSPGVTEMAKLTPLLHLLFQLIDKVAEFTLSNGATQRGIQVRKTILEKRREAGKASESSTANKEKDGKNTPAPSKKVKAHQDDLLE